MKEALLKQQEYINNEMQEAGYNVVNCGECGNVFLHRTGVEELTCPYCEYTEELSYFPDFIYDGMAESLMSEEVICKQ